MALLLGHHNPRGVATISICVVFGLLAFAATSLRLWARRLKKTGLCFNDYAIFVALVSSSFNISWKMLKLTMCEMFAEGLVITVILGMLSRAKVSSSTTQCPRASNWWIRPTCAVINASGIGHWFKSQQIKILSFSLTD